MSDKRPSLIDPEIEKDALAYLDAANLPRDTPDKERESLLGAIYFLLLQRDTYLDILTQVNNNAQNAARDHEAPEWLVKVRKAVNGFYDSKEGKARREVLLFSSTDVTARVEWPSIYDAIPIPFSDPFWRELQEYVNKETFKRAYAEPFYVVTKLRFAGAATAVFIIGKQSGQTLATIAYPPLEAL